MTQKQHVMHGRDHEHGAADPIRIAWEDVGTGGGGTGGGGIQFNINNFGDWLYIETTEYITLKGDRLLVDVQGGINSDIQLLADKRISLQSASATIGISLTANNGEVNTQAYTIKFNSFTQKFTPITLQDVIALLQGYGLAA